MPKRTDAERLESRIEQLKRKDLILSGKINHLQQGRADLQRELASLEQQRSSQLK